MDDRNIENALLAHKVGHSRKLYKAEADAHKAEALQADVRRKTAALFAASDVGKVDFRNLEDVMARTRKYLDACAASGTFPSIMGLAAYGLGVDRRAVYYQIQRHPDSPTTLFLNRVRDLIADTMTNAALTNNANTIATIFVLKNGLGFSDKIEIEPITTITPEDSYSEEEIRARYMIDTEEAIDE